MGMMDDDCCADALLVCWLFTLRLCFSWNGVRGARLLLGLVVMKVLAVNLILLFRWRDM
jgi:hypothetical protein